MKITVTERIKTSKSKSVIIDELRESFEKVAENVNEIDSGVAVESINATFGSINRKDTTEITIKEKDNGFLMTAEVTYKPSVVFWILLAITIWFAVVGAVIPVGFYLWHKKLVREEIEKTFKNVRYEVED